MAFSVVVIHATERGVPWTVIISSEDGWNTSLSFEKDEKGDSTTWRCTGVEVSWCQPEGASMDMQEVTPSALTEVAGSWDNYLNIARSALEFELEDAVKQTNVLREQGQGRRGLDDSFYRLIAEQYREVSRRSDHPTHSIALHHDVARSTASNWIAKCRELGYLGPASVGKAGETKKRSAKRRKKGDRK